MTRSLVILQIVIALSSSAFAADREFCSGESCAPDVMAVHFTTRDGSAEIRDLNVGDEFTVWVVIRNVDSVINAFSLGVAFAFAGNLGPVFLAGLPLFFGVVFVVVMCFNS